MTRLRRIKCCHRICAGIPTVGCSCRPKPVTGSRPRSNRDGCSSTTNPGMVHSCQRLKNPLRQTRGARLRASPRAKRDSLVLYRDARMSREDTTAGTREVEQRKERLPRTSEATTTHSRQHHESQNRRERFWTAKRCARRWPRDAAKLRGVSPREGARSDHGVLLPVP